MPLKSFADALPATKPDLIVPGDDLATLTCTVSTSANARKAKRKLAGQLIERSLGAPESFPVVYARERIYRTGPGSWHPRPEDRGHCQPAELKKWVARMGFRQS